MAIETNGVIYYKLDSNIHGYTGDITKNCGLRGEEVDSNFNFLRGQDIKTISFNNEGELVIERYNGQTLNALPVNGPEYDFSFNSELGVLTIITPNKEEIKLEGFPSTNVYHDYTFKGNGTQTNPLTISHITRTGRYLPAIKLIDTTNNEYLPSKEEVNLHDRYITKENINLFGRLYSLKGVEEISLKLSEENSEWHIPTKEEWDELLNLIDCINPNHDSTESNVELGEFAGAALKDKNYWKEYNGKILSDDKFDFSIYPVGYCGDRGKDYYGSFGETACYWTSTVEDNYKDMFIKSFNYDKETVRQNTWSENYYLSLRLVKKFTSDNLNEYEVINGYTCECIHIPGSTNIWTKYNVDFSQFDNFVPSEWEKHQTSDDIVTRYFLNDWNGNNWDKLEIKEGESIVLYNSEKGSMHEFILINGELIDHSVYLNEEFQSQLDNINNLIKQNEETISSSLNDLNDRLIIESESRLSENTNLQTQIDAEAKERYDSDNLIKETINEESERAKEEEKRIEDLLNEKIFNAEGENILVKSLLNQEIERAKDKENELNVSIKDEILRSTTEEARIEKELISSLNQEVNRATLRENEIENKLTFNGENAILISNENKTISLKIDDNDPILTNDSNGLSTSLSLKWVHGDVEGVKDEIQLIGKDNIILSRIDIKELINNDEVINTLQTEVNTLKEELKETKNEIKSLIERLTILETKSITNITGVDSEISVTVTDNTAKIGFAENAQFIAG